MYFTYYESPIGVLTLGEENSALTYLLFGEQSPAGYTQSPTPFLIGVSGQLTQYFAGRRKSFDIPLNPSSTAYRKSVWKLLLDIPYGETITYGELARRTGNPKASRAVGGANHHNPISIIIPCHRVIGAGGKLTGYGGGLEAKAFLLQLEQDYIVSQFQNGLPF